MIPFVDLQVQYRSIREEVQAAISGVLESSQFVLGSEVAAFEEEFAAYSGAAFGMGVNNGTSALHLALLAAGVGPGDEVITVSATFVATAAAITYTGARPVFVDVDPRTSTMDPTLVEAAITERTKAIIPVHLYGQPADMDPIVEVARRHGLVVIEDAAQAHGAFYKGRRVGSLGDMACFSFYPSKNLGAYGEGGMVVTSSPEFARAIRLMRDWGQEPKYHHVVQGFNYRLEGIQGAILRVKLRYLDEWSAARARHAAAYDVALAESSVGRTETRPDNSHVFHVYPIYTPQREALQQALRLRDIHTAIHYPIPVHLQPIMAEYGFGRGDLPVTERLFAQELSLPMYPELPEGAVEQVAEAIMEWEQSLREPRWIGEVSRNEARVA